jgi:tetratricopeptide (TPR) repeat protein
MKGAGQQTAPDFSSSLQNPAMIEAALALLDNKLSEAEPLLRAELKANPFNVAAIRMMAELAGRIGRLKDAEPLLRRALELSPGFTAARSNLATVLYRLNRPLEAVTELTELQALDPEHLGNANLKAAALGRLGDFAEALALYDQILERLPDNPKVLMSYGHTLKTVGRQDESISAYRRALGIQPTLGEVWWSLANLKTARFSADDVAQMEAGLSGAEASEDDRFHLHFALGKAYEDGRDAEASFTHYEAGNQLRSSMIGYDAADTSAQVDADIRLFSPEFFAARAGQGCLDSAPIFILGMPRAGSTLIEQILASHSLVEGTMELPDIPVLAQRHGNPVQWAERIAAMTGDQLRKAGEAYIARTRIQRKTDKPFFIDKLPNNWAYVGFIRLILPNAKIIDARRHPLACCFSNYKQHFARGQAFTYGLDDVGRYYADYVRQMAHFDRALPGAVTRVIHEDMLDDNESEIRNLLAALGLPFEESCLRFWENDRAVRTASSEQVRRPINREGADQWQLFDPWLKPLRDALGDVLDDYPAVPKKWAAF